MKTARLTRTVRFSAAHRYFRPEWSEDRNREIFGACANAPGHGHDYRCSVTVEGPVAKDTSMVLNLSAFDDILRAEVLEPLDHQHLNHAVPEFGYGKEVPTAEALAAHLWDRIARRLPSQVELTCVRIQEGPDLFAEYLGAPPGRTGNP